MQRDLTQPVSTPDAGTERSSTLTAPLCSFLVSALLAVSLAGCGGGGSGPGSSLNDGFGPGNPSSCPKAQLSDAWFNNRLGCLANDQRFISGAAADGAPADRAYIFGQQVLDGRLNDVLGANVLRYFKFALCVRNAPANVAPSALAGALATALGLNVLANSLTYYPPGVSGSTFQYGGIADTNTLQVSCDPAKHPVIVNYATGRIESVNAAALSALQIFDR